MKNIERETAELAKQKGYNPPYYQVKRWYDLSVKNGDVIQKALSPVDYNPEKHIAVVTQTLLQQWLATKNLDVLPEVGNNGKKFYKCRVWYDGNHNVGYVTIFNTFEEALEEGMKLALNEIGIKRIN